MNFTIDTSGVQRIDKKPVLYKSNCQLSIQRCRHAHQQRFKAALTEYFESDAMKYVRLSELIRLIRIASFEKDTQFMAQFIVDAFKKGTNGEPGRYYNAWKMLTIEGCIPLNSILREVPNSSDRIDIYGLLLAMSMFLPNRNLLLSDLEAGFSVMRNEPLPKLYDAVERVLARHSKGLDMSVVAFNLETLKISSAQYRQLLVGLFKRLGERLNPLIKKGFEKILDDLAEGIPNNSRIEYLFEWLEELQPLYSQCLKSKLSSMQNNGSLQQLIAFHHRLSTALGESSQLSNLFELSLREWFNDSGNGLKIVAGTFDRSEEKAYVLQNFVGLFENYKDVERTYIRLQLKRLPARDNELNQSLQSIIGRNYTSKLEAFTKEVGTAMSIKGTLKIFTISKLLYPRQWKQLSLAPILSDSRVAQCLKSLCQEAFEIIGQLNNHQANLNTTDSLKNYAFAHHRIVVEGQFGLKTLSLEQLISFCTNSQPTGDYQTFYPTLDEQSNQLVKEVEALPNYVVESRIVRFLKKNKSGKPDAIAKEVGSNEELIKVLLEQLIKKEFVKKEGDVYHYLP